MFNTITFWCEFPAKTNWEIINKSINFNANIYIASESKKEFLKYKSKISNKNIKIIGAWPTLKIEEGYWFSSFTNPLHLKKLKEFDNIPIKIDLEPPIFKGKSTNYKAIKYLLKHFFLNKGKNKKELEQTVQSLKQPLIISTFPMPKFLLKKIGYFENSYSHNYFVYTSLIPKLIRPLIRIYYKRFIRSKINSKKETMFAIGCTGAGIFGNEEAYSKMTEFKKDLEMLNRLNVKNAVIFELSSLSNKPDSKEWFKLLNSFKA